MGSQRRYGCRGLVTRISSGLQGLLSSSPIAMSGEELGVRSTWRQQVRYQVASILPVGIYSYHWQPSFGGTENGNF